MIKINLIDAEELEKLKQVQKRSSAQSIQITSPKVKKGITIGVSVASLFYVMFILYFVFMVRKPLVDLKKELADTKSAVNQLKPGVEAVNELEKNISEIKKKTSEYDKFIEGRFNLARILNILSNELPDEIIFQQLTFSPKELVVKERTKNGLVTSKTDAMNLSLNISVPEEYQGKVSQYVRKLKENDQLSKKMIKIENTGLSLRNKSYTGNIEIFFKLPEDNKNE